MKKLSSLLVAALAAVCAFAAVAAFADMDRVNTTVSLKFSEGGGTAPYYGEDSFKGKVRGDRGCKKDRQVKVFKEGGGLVGKDDTNDRGRYAVPANNPTGDFFAKVKRTTIKKANGDKVKCSRAKSDSVSAP